jgi:hypothetical protein
MDKQPLILQLKKGNVNVVTPVSDRPAPRVAASPASRLPFDPPHIPYARLLPSPTTYPSYSTACRSYRRRHRRLRSVRCAPQLRKLADPIAARAAVASLRLSPTRSLRREEPGATTGSHGLLFVTAPVGSRARLLFPSHLSDPTSPPHRRFPCLQVRGQPHL